MNAPPPGAAHERRAQLVASAAQLRPELHRYCARLTGSVIEGEDVVQDTMLRALAALPGLDDGTPLAPWLFRIAHNRALDLLRSRAVRTAAPIEEATDVPDPAPDAMESLMRQEAVRTAVSRFTELRVPQRSAVILKDVLGHSLAEIADLLELSIDAVKAHLARGRVRLREINARAAGPQPVPPASPEVARYAALFNKRDWAALRALLADDVKLQQSSFPLRAGAEDVGLFFTIYARVADLRLEPAWVDGREVIAVFDGAEASAPNYFMWLMWHDGRISFIRDYRHVRYVAADAELALAAPRGAALPGA